MIRQQLEVVTSEEYHRLFDEEIESQFNPDHFHEATNQRVNQRVDRLEEENSADFNAAHEITNDRFVEEEIKNAPAPTPEVDYPATIGVPVHEDTEATRVDLNRDELLNNVEPEEQEVDSRHAELEAMIDEEAQAEAEREKRAAQRRESVLGQTIRIELPKD